ncbi:spore gernimation protein [Gordoniibacillus kamchatkensis]|uniref:Spore gernimation protein n=1 Tax=Gordoniibacillus kamchatkensis TaxID=1590651 RepID=A0ABR5AIV9_9BACL|nr:GerAB/ArcD/ProY family transporter [Paenibacillus sp. VKM B-2647]KIL40982.1 spore gernimation protein [Paenibacillus sp. VKM B-2647]
MERIGKYELAAMIILFEVGSSSLFQLGAKANRDAWISMLLAFAAGLLLLGMFLYINGQEGRRNFADTLRRHFGRWLGTLVAAAYSLYFAYESMRNVRDFGDLMATTFLTNTPISFIMLVLILLSGYAVYKGVEVFFRTVGILLPLVGFSYILLIVLFFASDVLRTDRILPVLEDGIAPVLKAVPSIVMFPFGQMVVFLIFWQFAQDKSFVPKVSICAYLVTGTILTILNVCNIMILGAPLAGISSLPLLHAVRMMTIGAFMGRIDAFVVMLLFLALFVKATLWYLSSVVVLGQLAKRTDHRAFVAPAGVLIYFASFLEPNYIYHIWIGIEVSTLRIFPWFQIALPAALLLIIAVKKRRSKR